MEELIYIMDLSVIIPAYNAEKTIEMAINSVLKQETMYKYEILVINDGSMDNTKYICEKIKDKRIKIINIKNSGPSKARNIGIQKSNGKYIMFLDSDDYYEQGMINNMINEIREHYDFVCCDYMINNKKVEEVKNLTYNKKNMYVFLQLLHKNQKFNVVWNKIYKKDIIITNNIKFDETTDIAEDHKFNLHYMFFTSKGKYINKKVDALVHMFFRHLGDLAG